jgi:hypothetical protein
VNQLELDLALKKQRLQLRSAELRRQVSVHAAAAAPLLAVAARVRDVAQWLRAHPLLPLAALAALLVLRPRRAMRWGRRAFFVWRLAKRLGAWLSAAAAGDRGVNAAHR